MNLHLLWLGRSLDLEASLSWLAARNEAGTFPDSLSARSCFSASIARMASFALAAELRWAGPAVFAPANAMHNFTIGGCN